MKRFGRFLRGLPLGALLLVLTGGCNTYHYYDITITSQSPVTATELSSMNTCEVVVSGAASDVLVLSSNPSNNTGCPPSGSTIGIIEYASFADSGNITFTFNGYQGNVDSTMVCTTGNVQKPADGDITQTGIITLTSFSDTLCPPHVTTGTP